MDWNIIRLQTIDSTNTYAMQYLAQLPDHTAVIAGQQTSGRGQFNRVWNSKSKANLYFSLVLKPELSTIKISELAFLTAQKIVSVLETYLPLSDIKIKLPNDILVRGKKICGILIETKIRNILQGLVIGIGLNLDLSPEIAAQIDQPATGLKQETEKEVNKERILRELLSALQ